MKLRYSVVLPALFLALLSASAGAQDYDAFLDGLQQVPPNASPAVGTGLLTLDRAKVLSYSGLLGTEFAAHVHVGAAGVNGGIVFSLPAGSPKNGTFGPLAPVQEADLQAGLRYINVHTTPGFSGGEIRGQISSAPVATESATWGRIKALYTR